MRAFVLWVTLIGGWSAIIALVIVGPTTLNTDVRGSFCEPSINVCLTVLMKFINE